MIHIVHNEPGFEPLPEEVLLDYIEADTDADFEEWVNAYDDMMIDRDAVIDDEPPFDPYDMKFDR